LQVSVRKDYIIYATPFEFIAQKGKYTAHGKTVKQAIQDLKFKITSEQLKKEPIYMDTKITVAHYRAITGACNQGIKSWLTSNKIAFTVKNEGQSNEIITAKKSMTVAQALPILEKTNAYGVSRLKELIK
jgi:hypothetical protein